MNAPLRSAALVAVAFGVLTVFSGGRVLFGEGAAAAGAGLWLRRRAAMGLRLLTWSVIAVLAWVALRPAKPSAPSMSIEVARPGA